MACLDSKDPQFDARAFDAKMREILSADGEDFFTSYHEFEVYDSFDSMALLQDLLRSEYAYGATKASCSSDFLPQTRMPCPSPPEISSLVSQTYSVKNPTVSRPILLKKKLRKWKWRTG